MNVVPIVLAVIVLAAHEPRQKPGPITCAMVRTALAFYHGDKAALEAAARARGMTEQHIAAAKRCTEKPA